MRTAVKLSLMLCMLVSPMVSMAAWDGGVEWAARTELSTATSGVVAKVMVRAGQHISKGELLLQLEQDALRARVSQGKAELNHKKLLLEEAGRELERAEELYARTLLADHDLDLAKIAHADADAAYQRSRAEYQLALERLRHSELRAPFDAVVIERLVEPAETVVTQLRAEPMLVLASATKKQVRFMVGAEEIGTLVLGQKLLVEVGGKRYDATVEAFSSIPGNNQSGYSVTAVFEAGQEVFAGMKARVSKP